MIDLSHPRSDSIFQQVHCALNELIGINTRITSEDEGRRRFRINTDRFPKRTPKAHASMGVRGYASPGNFSDFNSLKSPFLGF